MTSILSCVVASIALAADPGSHGLPFGIPPAPEDPVISHVAPPQCLFYVDWAGTASPSAASSSETERLLAEPEVQELFNGLGKVFVACLRSQDKQAKETAVAAAPTSTVPALVTDQPVATTPAMPAPAAAVAAKLPQTAYKFPLPWLFGMPISVSSPALACEPCTVAQPPAADSCAAPTCVPTLPTLPATATPIPARQAANAAAVNKAPAVASSSPETATPKVDISAQDYGDFINVLLTHPTAVFIEDVRVVTHKPAEKKADTKSPSGNMSEAKEPEVSTSPDVEIQAGMVVSLGSDSARLHATFIKYLTKAKKAGADGGFQQFKIGGKNWYRSKPSKPGDKNLVTFGFHEKYFVAGVGDNAVEHILARWNSPKPAWLAKALAQTVVPRRTGIIYLNLKLLREKLLPLAPSQKDAVAILELLGLDNADSLVSTTGLEDYGMINRVLLAFDGKPHGLLDMVADRPLTAKDLEPIPNDALFAMAARVDLNRTLKTVAAASEKAVGDNNLQKSLEEIKKQSGVELHYFLSSLGDTWCAYNSPTEGEVAFLGWTAVVPIRDRAKLLDSWEKLCAAPKKMQVANEDAGNNGNRDSKSSDDAPAVIRKCRFAGHEIYYVAGQAIAPAFYVSDREMVMTLNMPEMKAYLARKNHRSLATLPGVALALSDRNAPVALGFCDTPRLFDFLYPLISLYSTAGAAMAQQGQIELDPTFWPSAGAIRSHLRPDITTVERTPNGLQLTCRYCLPSGGANGPLWLIGLSVLGGGYENLVNLSPHTQSSSVCQQEPVGCAPVALPAPLGEQKPSSTISSPCCTAAAASPAPNSGSSYNTAAPVGTAVSSYGKTTPYGTAPALPAPSYGYPSSYGASVAPLPPSSGTSYKAAPANVSMPSLGYPSAVASSPNPYLSSPPLVPLGANYRAPMATPRAASAMTIADVVAMSRAGVDETLMVTQIHLQGLAAPLQASDIISLHQQGIGRNVIAALQAECATTAKRAAVHDDRSPRSPQGAAPTYRPHPYTPPSPPKQ